MMNEKRKKLSNGNNSPEATLWKMSRVGSSSDLEDEGERCPVSSQMPDFDLLIGPNYTLTLSDFWSVVTGGRKVALSDKCKERLASTSKFVEHLLEKNIKVYGLTTGFADLREVVVPPSKCALLSHNIIHSHDTGIGKPQPSEVVLGAMLLRANSLSKGFSGFSEENLNVLIDMINKRIIPVVPSTGSLGASGDLAFLARIGRAMEGVDDVIVYVEDTLGKKRKKMSAEKAFEKYKIKKAKFKPKEGLALTNGTPFLCATAVLAYNRLVRCLENCYGVIGLFMNSAKVVDAAFSTPIQHVKGQVGQIKVAEILRRHLVDSPFVDRVGVQDDYLIRCMPQIFGYQYELVHHSYSMLISEMNAVTDNPLIYRGSEITNDISPKRLIDFNGQKWAVLSGGNFHGEYIAQLCDSLCRANVKPILTMERHLTYLLNPARGKKKNLPSYLVHGKEKAGLRSGFMCVQYTANALAHKISFEGLPMSIFNITSANESEDVVSYGATAAQKLLDQLDHMYEFLVLYTAEVLQAYSIQRENVMKEKKLKKLDEDLLSEKIFKDISECVTQKFPFTKDMAFDKCYADLLRYFGTNRLRKIMNFPLNIKDPRFPKKSNAMHSM